MQTLLCSKCHNDVTSTFKYYDNCPCCGAAFTDKGRKRLRLKNFIFSIPWIVFRLIMILFFTLILINFGLRFIHWCFPSASYIGMLAEHLISFRPLGNEK